MCHHLLYLPDTCYSGYNGVTDGVCRERSDVPVVPLHLREYQEQPEEVVMLSLNSKAG